MKKRETPQPFLGKRVSPFYLVLHKSMNEAITASDLTNFFRQTDIFP